MNVSGGNVVEKLKKSESRLFSWNWKEQGFEEILSSLRTKRPEMTESAGLINESSGKMVWRLQMRNSDGKEYDFAYKINPGKTPWRYILKPSLAMREALNYRMFEDMGLPVAHLLAVGDLRKSFILKENYIATAFVGESLDGRCFMPGGSMQDDEALRFEFTLRNIELLAKIHDRKVFHKAFHPRNLLWKGSAGNMQVFWIDVARCRPVTRFMSMRRAVLVDLHTFFRDMQPRKKELERIVEHYLSCRQNGSYPGGASALIDDLYNFKRRLFSKKRYTVCRGE